MIKIRIYRKKIVRKLVILSFLKKDSRINRI